MNAMSSCFFKSRTMLRLLRLRLRNDAPMPGLRAGAAFLMTSPSGLSTLITSAPMSPRIWVAYGPMTTVVMSITRTPASGPLISVRLGQAQHALGDEAHDELRADRGDARDHHLAQVSLDVILLGVTIAA